MEKNIKKLNEEYRSKRGEEINDIVDRMPTNFGKWVAIAVFTFFILFFVFTWIIKYPDTVTGKIKINSYTTPVKLTAQVSGKLEILGYNVQDNVNESDYIGVIQNTARTKDVQKISRLLSRYHINNIDSLKYILPHYPEKVSLGSLNMQYYSFLTSLKKIVDYYEDNNYRQQRVNLTEGIRWKKRILEETENALQLSEEQLEISKKWYEKYSSLNKTIITTHEYETDRSKLDIISSKQNNQVLIKEAVSIQMQITDSENKLSQLSVEQKEKETQLYLDLLVFYHELVNQIESWEQTYVLKAPLSGQVEFLKFWVNNQFIRAGEDIFSIVPSKDEIFGQVFLPATGAGKVKIGSRVAIKLDDYPYNEFGAVNGIVKSVSLVANEQKIAEQNINTYLILVEMPNGLITNYGDNLDFKHEIEGIADIIVKERRLIERLFDNLKFNTQ